MMWLPVSTASPADGYSSGCSEPGAPATGCGRPPEAIGSSRRSTRSEQLEHQLETERERAEREQREESERYDRQQREESERYQRQREEESARYEAERKAEKERYRQERENRSS